MSYKTFGHRLPYIISAPLFGDRKRFGLTPVEDDPCWTSWKENYHSFYENTQKKGVGQSVNDAGYKILNTVDMDGLNVLEVGPGGLFHIEHWKGKPEHYVLVDLDEDFLDIASDKLRKHKIPFEKRMTTRSAAGVLPSGDNEFDLIVTFYSLEHLYPFHIHLDEMLRVLKPGGRIIGAIPAEGGLAWGLGRFLTSRRWLKRNTNINPDKIICWEHPTMADEILNIMSKKMDMGCVRFWPLFAPSIDLNLVIKFIFQKRYDS